MASLIRLKQIESSSALETSAQVGTDFNQSVVNIVSGSIVGVLPDGIISSSQQVNLLSASNYDGFVVQLDMTMSSDLERNILSASISSSNAAFTVFSSSIDTTILNKMNVVGVISSSTQLTGATLKGITIAPVDSDSYSLIVSGALAIVGATGLQNGVFGDSDSTVPAQLYLDGNAATASTLPQDPSTNNQANSNMVDMGEF